MIDIPRIPAADRRRAMTKSRRSAAVVARWAIDSKKPGRHQGYRLFGGVDTTAVADHLIEVGSMLGTSTGRNTGRADELPWIGFLGGATAVPPLCGVVSRNWSDSSDSTGAPILPTRATWLPWDRGALRGAELTYAATYAGVRQLSWPAVDGGPAGEAGFRVDLPVPEPDWDAVVADIGRFGVEFVAELAACVVQGKQVVVVVPESTTIDLDERIRLLDAVAALLPYGARNCVMVATWAHHQNRHLANLSFAAAAQRHQALASLADRTVDPRPTAGSCAYLAELRSVLAEGHPLGAVVTRLRHSTAPLAGLGEITAAVLARMRLPRVVTDEIRSGAVVSVDRVRVALVEIAASDLFGVPFQRVCVEYLARRACEADAAVAARARKVLGELWDDEFAVLIGEYCRRETEIESEWATEWLTMVLRARKHCPTAVLGYLGTALRAPVLRPDEAGFRTSVRIVAGYLSTADRVDAEVWPLLLGQRHVLTRALHTIVRRPSTGEFATMWPRSRSGKRTVTTQVGALGDHTANEPGARWLTALLQAAAGRPARIEARDVRTLLDGESTDGALFAEILIDKCDHDAAVRAMAPPVGDLFRAHRPDEGGRPVAAVLGPLLGLAAGRLAPDVRARLDVWRFALGNREHADPIEAAAASADYDRAFWQALADLDAPWAERVARNAARFLVAGPVDFVHLDSGFRDLVRAHYLDELVRVAATLSADRVRHLALTLPDGWWDQVAETEGLAWYRAVGRLLTAARTHASPPDVAASAIAALADDRAVPDVLAVLRDHIADSGSRTIDHLLRLLHAEPSSRAVALTLLADVASGACGPEIAGRFGRYAAAERDWYILLARGGAETQVEEAVIR